MDEMNTKELARLSEWLLANGHTSEEVLECLQYIAGTTPAGK